MTNSKNNVNFIIFFSKKPGKKRPYLVAVMAELQLRRWRNNRVRLVMMADAVARPLPLPLRRWWNGGDDGCDGCALWEGRKADRGRFVEVRCSTAAAEGCCCLLALNIGDTEGGAEVGSELFQCVNQYSDLFSFMLSGFSPGPGGHFCYLQI